MKQATDVARPASACLAQTVTTFASVVGASLLAGNSRRPTLTFCSTPPVAGKIHHGQSPQLRLRFKLRLYLPRRPSLAPVPPCRLLGLGFDLPATGARRSYTMGLSYIREVVLHLLIAMPTPYPPLPCVFLFSPLHKLSRPFFLLSHTG